MKKELAEQFSREVESYRKALLFYARKNDWEEFKTKAGRLFDYVESIEHVELERRFFSVFYVILAALVLTVIALFGINFGISPELMRLKNTVLLAALVVGSFELYFFINYRTYAATRTSIYTERRENFIRGIERDFRSFNLQLNSHAA
jgi:Na+/H+ antiporter NhaC